MTTKKIPVIEEAALGCPAERQAALKAGEVTLTNLLWGTGYAPEVKARLVYAEEKGFLLQMECQEKEPRAVWKNFQDPVFEDSCMEFFVNFFPEREESGYFNFEMNAAGAYICGYGNVKPDRKRLSAGVCEKLTLRTEQKPDSWQAELFISLEFLHEVLRYSDFEKGHQIACNFYKCGDCTEQPHFISWNKVGGDKPNFHQPLYFGVLELA